MDKTKIKFVFFGNGPLAESSLYHLYQNGLTPYLVITSPDKKSGRHMEIHPSIIKTWCEGKNIKVWQPETLKNIEIESSPLGEDFDLFIVASYPKILSENILNIPKHGSLNIHPSLLPKYRGPSPIQTSLLNGDSETGITIIKLDKEVDHGPILIQNHIQIVDEDINEKLERKSGAIGAEMLSQVLEHYIDGNIKLIEQDHNLATFTRKFEKKEGEIKLEDNAEIVQNKFRAFLPHIPLFFFINHKDREIRVKVTEINLSKDFAKDKTAKEIIEKVIPEGKSEMTFKDFEKGYLN
jgi:methionyl-tRNA formyltransferase